MSSPEAIMKALSSLDANNPNHWTADGLPRLDTVKMLAGDQSITREAVTQAAPGFSQASVVQAAQAAVTAPPVVTAPPATETVQATLPAAETVVPAAPPAPAPEAAVAPVVPAAQVGLPPTTATLATNLLAQVPATNTGLLAQKSDQLADIEDRIVDVKRAQEQVNKEYAKLQAEADDLRIQIDKLTPRDDNQHAIQNYLASRREALAQRAAQIGRVRDVEKELGFKLSDLAPKRAPIDTAMARRTGHGHKRPGK
jgi:hypothetical protein